MFVKSQMKRLPQVDETWEADFRALPKPFSQSETEYLGLVVTVPDGFLLAYTEVEGRPTVNDLAKLLAEAMRRPLVEEGAHRPTRINVRGHHQWRELFPHLKELKIDVAVENELPEVEQAFAEFLERLKKPRRRGRSKATAELGAIEMLFPAVARWVDGFGHIEIGDQEGFGFIVRALDYGGVVFEDNTPMTLAKALATLEKRLREWFDEEGIELSRE